MGEHQLEMIHGVLHTNEKQLCLTIRKTAEVLISKNYVHSEDGILYELIYRLGKNNDKWSRNNIHCEERSPSELLQQK